MKKEILHRIMASVFAVSSLFVIASCSDDDEPSTKEAPIVSLSTSLAQDVPGAMVSVTVTVDAPNGGKTLQISGGVSNPDVTLRGSSVQEVEVDIVIPANAVVGSSITAVFIVVDKANLSSTPVELTITVGDPLVILQGNITTNTTLEASKRYLIRGKVYVQAPATLTIPAGTVLFGEKDTQGALIINRGAKIDAKGTAANPIIMTSQAPKGYRNRGDWGGLIILGKAYNSNGATTTIEGISGETGSENGVYGPGTGNSTDDDNSGFLQYARIEFAGIALNQDNELNSLTMGSVGSGTTIDHIMVTYANDDAYEWFGGSVNQKYLIAYSTIDDDLDTDRGYNGKTQYVLVVRDPMVADFSGARAWESSSNSNATAPTVGGVSRHSTPKFSHVTVVGPLLFRTAAQINQFYRAALEINSSSAIEVHNSIISGFPNSANFATAGSVVNNNVFAANTTQAAAGASAPASFATDNTLESSIVNVFGAFPSGSVYSFANFPVFQTATSPYLTGAINLNTTDTFFDNAVHYGAFGTDASSGWNYDAGWVEFDPINANY